MSNPKDAEQTQKLIDEFHELHRDDLDPSVPTMKALMQEAIAALGTAANQETVWKWLETNRPVEFEMHGENLQQLGMVLMVDELLRRKPGEA